jgi:hypothetical protein
VGNIRHSSCGHPPFLLINCYETIETIGGIKVDTYSVGVIISTTVGTCLIGVIISTTVSTCLIGVIVSTTIGTCFDWSNYIYHGKYMF